MLSITATHGTIRRVVPALALLIAISSAPAHLSAQCLEGPVEPIGVGSSAMYGFSIARSGPMLAVGSPGFPAAGPGAGAVFIFTRVGAEWMSTSILFADGVQPGDNTGSSLAMDGDTLVVGLRKADDLGTDSGSVHVFEFSGFGWVDVATLTDPTGGEFNEFGASVAIDGDVIVVGSPFDIVGVNETGSASVFRRVGGVWQHEQKLLAAAGDNGDSFGTAVAVRGNRLAVGAPESNPAIGLDAGSIHVFEFGGATWNETATLTRQNGAPGDLLGTSLSMEPNLIMAGAPFANDAAFEGGAVIPFRRDGSVWLEGPEITSPNPGSNRYFGSSIDITGSELIVGEPFATVGSAFAAGAAHRFVDLGTTFLYADTVTAALPGSGALLGASVAVEGGEAIVGASLENSGGFASGAAYRFVLDGADCDANGTPDLCDIAAGLVSDCDGNGIPDSCDVLQGNGTDCDGNGLLDSCDLALGAIDCDGNLVLDSCELDMNDCNANGTLDVCEPDCNDNGTPDDCDIDLGIVPDCNANGNPDDCDLFFGLSTDCNGNLIPDECDLVTGVSEDCNMNGQSDTCDIDFGVSDDINADGIPDECGTLYVRGDVNGDGAVDLTDAVFLLDYVATVGVEPGCFLTADVNGDSNVNVADGVSIITFLAGTGPPPPAPFPDCGFEPEPVSGLTCDTPPVCP